MITDRRRAEIRWSVRESRGLTDQRPTRLESAPGREVRIVLFEGHLPEPTGDSERKLAFDQPNFASTGTLLGVLNGEIDSLAFP